MMQKRNKRRQAGGFYLPLEDLRLALEEAYPDAIDAASLEAAAGRYDAAALEQVVNREEILNRALALIAPEVQPRDE